jgi:hypothetical protein
VKTFRSIARLVAPVAALVAFVALEAAPMVRF